MRILVVVGQLATGGAERVLYLFLRHLPPGIEAEVVVFSGRVDEPQAIQLAEIGVRVSAIDGALSTGRRMIEAIRIARRIRPDVVLSHSFYTNVVAEVLGRASGARAVGAIRGELVQDQASLGRVTRALCTGWPRMQITNNHAAVEQVARLTRWPFRPVRVEVVAQAVEDVPADPPPYPMERDEPLVLGVGSLLPRKRWDLLIDAAVMLDQKGHRFRVAIAGKGRHRPEVERHIERAVIGHRVALLGEVARPDALLREAAMLVLPSDLEGLPNVVLEAMAAARPVVATDAGDTRRAIEPAGAGYVVPRGDAVALAARIEALLLDPDLARRMGLAGWHAAGQCYRPERFVEETLGVLRARA